MNGSFPPQAQPPPGKRPVINPHHPGMAQHPPPNLPHPPVPGMPPNSMSSLPPTSMPGMPPASMPGMPPPPPSQPTSPPGPPPMGQPPMSQPSNTNAMPQLTNQMNQMNVGGNFPPPPPPGNFFFLGVESRILPESRSRRVFQNH